MTPKELAELAQLINEKWPNLKPERLSRDALLIGRRHREITLRLKLGDKDNASWIIWVFDRLEEMGAPTTLNSCPEGYMCAGATPVRVGFAESGKTRAEAVSRALLTALREKK